MKTATIYPTWQGSRLFDARSGDKLPGVKVGDYVLTFDGLAVVRANGRTDKQYQWLMDYETCAADSRFYGVIVGAPHTQREIDATHDAMLAATGRV